MENQKKNKKTYLLITLGVLAVIVITLGLTYAYWRLTKEQTGVNIVNSSCLNVSMENQANDINLENAFPISDGEGLDLEPFTFTVKNNCEEYADYTISLEMLSVTNLNSDFVKVALNEQGKTGTPKILGNYDAYEDLKLEDTKEGRTITSGKLEPNGEKSYELRIWLNGDVEVEDDAMNKTYKSKVVIESTIAEEPKIIELDKDIPLANDGEDGLYAIEHNNLSELGSEWNKTEYRYAGVDPDNYVEFNNEKWRIIGLVNVKTATGVEQRVKIIRTDGIEGQKKFGDYAWDRDYDSDYTNNWTTSKLKDMLNGIYYEGSNGECYIYGYYGIASKSECDFSGNGDLPKGLDDTARQMIDSEVIWNIGGSSTEEETVGMFYERERGTSTGDVSYPNVWTSENDKEYHKGIGIMYASDYGYATNGGEKGRESCFEKDLRHWTGNDYDTECANNDWLKPSSSDQALLLPLSSSSGSHYYLTTFGFIAGNGSVYSAGGVWPVGYLSPRATIYDGDGSINNPFKLRV